MPASTLEKGLEWVVGSPRDLGRLELVVGRPAVDERTIRTEAHMSATHGLVGDMWQVRPTSTTADRSPDPERQLTLMNARFALLVAGAPSRRALAGDQLFVDLDLSVDNVPAGTRLRLGDAVIEITAPPHRGCAKFVGRFGVEAMRFVNSERGLRLRLRGANARVVVDGTAEVGDFVAVER